MRGTGAFVPEYTHFDAQGSAVAATNASGQVTWRERYAPFGEELLNPAANNDNTAYTGHLKDDATGLNYMQARYYDPIIGRFLSTDPIGYQDQLNLYAYVGNDPVNATDPTGMSKCANADCSMSTIDEYVGQEGSPPIDSSLAGDGSYVPPAQITFENDDPNGPSPNQPVQTELAKTVENGVAQSGVSSVNINSTGRPVDPNSPGSHHPRNNAVDINRVNGKRVDDPTNIGPVTDLQKSFANQPGTRENFGPSQNTRTSLGGTVTDLSGSQGIVNNHQNHVHVSSQACHRGAGC